MLVHTRGMPEQIYADGTYLDKNPDWHAEDSPFKVKWIDRILAKVDEPIVTIAEVGCGAGEVLLGLASARPAASFSGFEVSPQAYAICSKKSTDKVKFYFEDVTKSDKFFDVLMAIDVFEHISDYMGFLRDVRTRAKYKVFHIPLDLSVQGMLRGKSIMYAREVVGHLHYFDKDTALATLADCGYEIVDWQYTFGSEELPNRPLRARGLNILRKALRMVGKDVSVRVFGGASLMVLTR